MDDAAAGRATGTPIEERSRHITDTEKSRSAALRERPEEMEAADQRMSIRPPRVPTKRVRRGTTLIGFAHFLAIPSAGPLREQAECLDTSPKSTNALLASHNNIPRSRHIDVAGA